MRLRKALGGAALSGLVLMAGSLGLAANNAVPPLPVNVIPRPARIEVREGTFTLSAATRILADPRALAEARYLAEKLGGGTGFKLPVKPSRQAASTSGTILLTTRRADPALGDEGYELVVAPDAVVLRAPRPAGLFYAVQTLRQLLPPEVDARTPVGSHTAWRMPCVRIEDRPRYGWRGFLVDSARSFHSKAFMLDYLDALAALKINVLHWHLTDSEAWRPEIRRYPDLVKPCSNTSWYTTQAEGCYSRQDIRAILARAKQLHIMIVPEIELPAHAAQAVAVIPGTICQTAEGQDLPPGVSEFCLGSDRSMEFLQNVLAEIVGLFPASPYIHIGGDEADDARWRKCPRCRARMQALGTDNPRVLQKGFVDRIARFVHGKGRTTVAWADHLDLGIPAGQVVHGWHGGEAQYAVQHGFSALSADNAFTYFDYPQVPAEPNGGWMPPLPLKQAYSFDPDPAGATPEQRRLILGSQAHLWATQQDHMYAKTFPRLLAFAEVVWSRGPRDLADFRRRLAADTARLAALGVSVGPEDRDLLQMSPYYDSASSSLGMRVVTGVPSIAVRYTTDGSAPTETSPLYADSIGFSGEGTIRMQAFFRGQPLGDPRTMAIRPSLARGRPYALTTPPSPRYLGTGPRTLTDGALGTLDFRDGLWQGWNGPDLEAVIDLGATQAIAAVEGSFQQTMRSWIMLPRDFTVWLSDDGTTWREAGTATHAQPAEREEPFLYLLTVPTPAGTRARWIKVRGRAYGALPGWHPGAGTPAWIFCDEIVVR